MKTIFAFCGLLLIAGGIWAYKEFRTPMVYGAFVGAPKAEVAELAGHPKENMGKTWAIEGTIQDQCTTMGCFFFFRDKDRTLRVDLQEIAMHAPMHKNGGLARVEGQMVKYGDGYQLWASAVEFR